MIWVVSEEQLIDENVRKHAGGKAREDLSRIFTDCGFCEIKITLPQKERAQFSPLKKVIYHYKTAKTWGEALNRIEPGDSLILQFPLVNHTLLFNKVLKKQKHRGVAVYAFIHDLETLRMSNDIKNTRAMRWRMKKEEIDELEHFDGIVVHNEKMKSLLNEKLNVKNEKMVPLEIFDYLTKEGFEPSKDHKDWKSCIIAGNLKREKSAYVYELPKQPNYELYGVNYEGNDSDNIHYHGSFLADELPIHLEGGFGLVWDGESAETCAGAWGDYLRYNNPHKTSLYLACGFPVIIWKDAALAGFVLEKKVGLTVSSLNEIDNVISNMRDEDYDNLRKNAMKVSNSIRRGHYTKMALVKMGLLDSSEIDISLK